MAERIGVTAELVLEEGELSWNGAGVKIPEMVLEEAELVWNGAEVKIPKRAGLEQG